MIQAVTNRPLKDSKGRESLEVDLRRMIQGNELDYDQPITTEMELAKGYGISRNTVRKALQALTNEGLLYKRHGLGTFVVPPAERSSERITLNKILTIIPNYSGEVAQLGWYDRSLVSGIADFSFHQGGQPELRGYGDSASRLLDQFRNLKFDGIIWERPTLEYYPVIEELHRFGVPQVTISRQLEDVPSLFFDYQAGTREVLRFLRGIGHREIVFIDLDHTEPVFTDRRRVFAEELRADGIRNPEEYVYPMKFKGITNADMDRVFLEHPKLTAIFFSVALVSEIWDYLQKRGCRIPQDLSLLSLEESEKSQKIGEISSLCEPRREIGWRAAHLIKSQKASGCTSAEPEYFPGELIIRKSCLSPQHLLKEQLS